MRLVSHGKVRAWLEERLLALEAYTFPPTPREKRGVPEVREHLPDRPDGEPRTKTQKLRFARGSMSLGDMPLNLEPDDIGKRFLVRIPWGVSMTGGFVFYAVLENLTESQAVFRALYHVGRLDDGSRVYAWKGYRFNMGRGDVRGREVQGSEGGPVKAKPRVEVERAPRPTVP